MCLLNFQLLSLLHAFLGTNSSHTRDGDRLLGWNAVGQHELTALALSLLFVSLCHEFFQLLHKEQAVVRRVRMIELENKRSTVRPPATSVERGLFMENPRLLV